MNYDVLSSDFSDFHSMIRINIEKQSKAKKNDLQIDWDKDTNWLFFFWEKWGCTMAFYLHYIHRLQGLPWWPSVWDSELPMQGTQVQSLVRELDPTCCMVQPKYIFKKLLKIIIISSRALDNVVCIQKPESRLSQCFSFTDTWDKGSGPHSWEHMRFATKQMQGGPCFTRGWVSGPPPLMLHLWP